MNIILVTGTREAKYGFWWKSITEAFRSHVPDGEWVIVHGAGRGIDQIADYVAHTRYDNPPVDRKTFPPQWNQFGKAAGPLRNQAMADWCDERQRKGDPVTCLAFHDTWDPKSGTVDMMLRARALGIPVHKYNAEGKIG